MPMQHAVESDEPQHAPLIFVAKLDPIAAQAVGVISIVPVDLELISIVPIQPILRAEPHEAPVVLFDATDRALGQTIFQPETPELDL